MGSRKNRTLMWLLLLTLAVCWAGSASALTEVSEQESEPVSKLSWIMGTDWEGFRNAVLEARKKGKTDLNIRLNSGTFREFIDTDLVWYHAARAGLMNAECSYSNNGQIALRNIEWWAWPMYLVDTWEDFGEAIRQAESGQMFGMLPEEALYREIIGNDRERERREYLAGLTAFQDLICNDDFGAFWYENPQIEEVTPVEARGILGCAGALREVMNGNPRGRIILAPDEETYRILEQDDALMDQVMTSAGISCPYGASDGMYMFLFPELKEACLPGWWIARAVRMGQEKELSLIHRLILVKARAMVRDVSGTDLEKAQQIHDLLCRHITYTEDDSTRADDCCEGALLNGKANCDGYSDAFFLCASLCGLDVRYISGDFLEDDARQEEDRPGGEEDGGHMWNLVFLDGTWRSVDVTWDDEEEESVSYQYFSIGLDWMEETYSFSRELLPQPFAEKTDLSWFSIEERTADSWEELKDAVDQILAAGETRAAIRCAEDVLRLAEEDRTPVYRSAAAGVLISNAYRMGEYILLEGITHMDPWRFCSTREEIVQAAEQWRETQPSEFYLTMEEKLFAELFADQELKEFCRLLVKGGVLSSGVYWWDGSCVAEIYGVRWYDGYYADGIETEAELTQAIRNGIREGNRNFCLYLSEALYQEFLSGRSRLSGAVQESGLTGSWNYVSLDEDCLVYIYSL